MICVELVGIDQMQMLVHISIKLKMKFSLTDLIEWIGNQQFDGEKEEQTKRIQRRLDGALCLKVAKESPGRPFVYCKFIKAGHFLCVD